MASRIVVTGATGRIGRLLCARLIARGDGLVVLTRDEARAAAAVPGAAAYMHYDGQLGGDWTSAVDGADAVIHLAGTAIFGTHQTRASVEAATDERVGHARSLVEAIEKARRRPAVLVAASSVGYYGYQGHIPGPVDEASPAGADWWGRDSERWEAASRAAGRLGLRTVTLRTSWVLDLESLAPQIEPFRHRFGGWTLPGSAWRPWIHPLDEIRLIEFALGESRVSGPLNCTAPNPVTSIDFGRALAHATGHRAWLPLPGTFLRLGMGVTADIVLHGRQVVPRRALELGFEFQYPTLDGALAGILGSRPTPTDPASRA